MRHFELSKCWTRLEFCPYQHSHTLRSSTSTGVMQGCTSTLEAFIGFHTEKTAHMSHWTTYMRNVSIIQSSERQNSTSRVGKSTAFRSKSSRHPLITLQPAKYNTTTWSTIHGQPCFTFLFTYHLAFQCHASCISAEEREWE